MNAVHADRGTVTPMIGYLRGTALAANILDVNGVGYLVHTPTPMTVHEPVELHVTTVVRDDAIVLYGFPTRAEQDLFAAVTKVSGIGPASALALLSSLGVDGLATAISAKDAKAISAVKGVGTKTAANLVALCQLPAGLVVGDPRAEDIVSALVGLGFDKPAARAAAEHALATLPDGDDADLIAAALAFPLAVGA